MNTLREYERDPLLPAAAGDGDLCPPSPERLTALVESALRRDDSPHATAARLSHVRWKPHVGLAALYVVRFDDGAERLVTWKRYGTDKAERVARARLRSMESFEPHLQPRAAWPGERVVVSLFPWDRELHGLARVFDTKRTCRVLAGTTHFQGLDLRYRRSSALLLRYKPERRAVVRFDAVTRTDDKRRATTRVGVRVLPVADAQRAVRARVDSGLCRLGLAPAWYGAEERTGLVFEEWLDVFACAHDDFSHSREIGAALARLHELPCPRGELRLGSGALLDVLPLFEVERRLWSAAHALASQFEDRTTRAGWVHGDFHPDQTAFERVSGKLRILDWDALAIGDPLEDVASWIADALAADAPGVEERFLEGYSGAGERAVDALELDTAVARALYLRAAATLRRLERGAREKAETLLSHARTRLTAHGAAR